MTELSWSTAADHDAGQSDENTHHERPTGTDWAPADTLELGYSSVVGQVSSTLAAYYPLAESSGATTANEVSGNGTDGTVSGPTPGSVGILGKNAYNFDGVDDYVDTGSIYGTGGVDNFAISVWVKQDGWTTSYENVFNNWDGAAGWGLQRHSVNPDISFYVRDDTATTRLNASTNIVDGNWHHVHAQYDRGNQLETWIDGALDTTTDPARLFDSGAWDANHWIGAEPGDTNANNPSGSNFWGGQIAHVMVWHDILTSSEIATLADPTTGTHTSSVQTS